MERSAEALLTMIREHVIRTKGELPRPIDLDTPLLEGLVDSFALIDLSEDISTAFGLPQAAGNLVPDDFETTRALWNRIQEVLA